MARLLKTVAKCLLLKCSNHKLPMQICKRSCPSHLLHTHIVQSPSISQHTHACLSVIWIHEASCPSIILKANAITHTLLSYIGAGQHKTRSADIIKYLLTASGTGFWISTCLAENLPVFFVYLMCTVGVRTYNLHGRSYEGGINSGGKKGFLSPLCALAKGAMVVGARCT